MSHAVPQVLIDAIVRTYAPRRVVLFGSAARGNSGPDSDLDLLVGLDDDAPAEALNWRRLHEARAGYTRPVDIVACRESVLKARARAIGSFADAAVRGGDVVDERH